MTDRTALITGVTGQDGAYLAELLLDKGYAVHGVKRRSSLFNTGRVDHLYHDPHERGRALLPALRRPDRCDQPDPHHPGDAADRDLQPRRAEPRRSVSFETPEYTANADALGTLRLLEAIRILGLEKTSALLPGLDLRAVRQGAGGAAERDDAVLPALPYGAAKLYAYWITVNYREAYGMLRLQRHPVQPREPDARRDLRHPQDHARGRARSSSACRTGSISAISTPSATGAMPATTSRACG